ncbi:hypothetical protein ACFWUW_26900 [Streptomyces sp. NPDC058655]|uniref:hypothetical protein n=1 Tax=Streptomyces sp. NPDC058655 TaxID=3346577 RepID=UPI003663F6D0
MTMAADFDEAVRRAQSLLASGDWQVTAADRYLASEVLATLEWLTAAPPALEPLSLEQRLTKLREALGALAAVAANPSSALGRFLAESVTVLAPIVRWHPPQPRTSFDIVPDPHQVSDAVLAFTRLRTLLLAVQGADG